jgi:YD repeat-containing protein
MEKRIFLMLLVVVYIWEVFQATAKPAEPQVKGGFRSCTVTDYRYKSGKINKKSAEKNYSQIFDEKGNPIELISYRGNKIIQKNKISNKYNTLGLLNEVEYFDNSGKVIIRFIYNYDDKRNKISDESFNGAGEVTGRAFYKYDDNNFLIEETHEVRIDSNEFTKGTTYYENDNKGNRIKESAVRSTDISLEVSTEHNFDDNNTTSEIDAKEENTNSLSAVTYEYTYDDNDNIILQTRYGIGDTKLVSGFSYDKYGNIVEQISYDENGVPGLKTVYEFSK